jgi:HSP20 family protein
MAEPATQSSGKTEQSQPVPARVEGAWRPFESLRREIDRLFDDVTRGEWHMPFRRGGFELEPFWKRERVLTAAPAVDIVEKDQAYEITAELPGMDEKNVDVKVAGGTLTISGEKREEREEKEKDYYLSERRYGSFQRTFGLPEGVDVDRIDARFKNGVLKVVLPKTPEAQKQAKKIEVKSA